MPRGKSTKTPKTSRERAKALAREMVLFGKLKGWQWEGLTELLFTFAQSEIVNAQSAESAALLRWRQWAQLVYLGGGPITHSDDELRAAICAAQDELVNEAKSR